LNYATIQYVHSVEIASRPANVSQGKRGRIHGNKERTKKREKKEK
jgi:hypothetical protein